MSDLAAAAPLHHVEAVTIVREVALRVARAELPGVPSAQVIRLCSSGALIIEGPIAADGSAVRRAAFLLETLLPGFEARAAQVRVPGALRLIVARALGSLDLPPYESIESFAEALSRFAAEDPARCIRELVASRLPASDVDDEDAEAMEPATAAEGLARRETSITVSDIRRARRATGMPLSEIARRCHIPARLLRELEWGYLDNWPAPHIGRPLIISYARAAGLDEALVTETLSPLLEERGCRHQTVEVQESEALPAVVIDMTSVEEVASTSLARFELPVRRRWNRRRVVAALTIPALLAIGMAPALWQHSAASRRAVPHETVAQAQVARPQRPQASMRTTQMPQPQVPQAQMPEAQMAGARATEQTPAGKAIAAPPVVSAAVSNDPEPPVPAFDTAEAHPTRLADVPTYSPTFAMGGSALFYHAEANGSAKLMRADTDSGGGVLRITSVLEDRAKNFHPRPSPDGKHIAFDSDRDGERGVYIADADGNHVQRVSGNGFAAVPSWSPDGRRLAFVRDEPGHPKVWNLWTLELRSGEMRRLTSYRVGQPWGGSWFPDGRRIAYSHEDQLVVLDLTKGTRRVYPSPVKGRLVRTPAVSPDGERVMFQVYRRGTWLLNLRSGAMQKVLADPTAEEYTWAPDGRRVAYHSRGAGKWGIWVLNKVGVHIVNTDQ